MSILLPNNLDWGVANWVSFGFFDDCLPHLELAPRLAGDVRFCVEAQVDTLDLRQAGRAELEELARLAARVLEQSRADGAAGFSDPTVHPVYIAKLEELTAIIERSWPGIPGKPQPG